MNKTMIVLAALPFVLWGRETESSSEDWSRMFLADRAKASDYRLYVVLDKRQGIMMSQYFNPVELPTNKDLVLYPCHYGVAQSSPLTCAFIMDFNPTNLIEQFQSSRRDRHLVEGERETLLRDGSRVEILSFPEQEQILAFVDSTMVVLAKRRDVALEVVSGLRQEGAGPYVGLPQSEQTVRIDFASNRVKDPASMWGISALVHLEPVAKDCEAILESARRLEFRQWYSPDFKTEHFDIGIECGSDKGLDQLVKVWRQTQKDIVAANESGDVRKWLFVFSDVSVSGKRLNIRWTYPTDRNWAFCAVLNKLVELLPSK